MSDWDPFKDEGATLIGDAPEWNPFRDEGATPINPVQDLLDPGQREFPEMDKTSLAQITVADWMERQHKIPFKEGLKNYKAIAPELGLDGNPEVDLKELKQRRELSMMAVKRLPNLSARIQQAEKTLDATVTANGVIVANDQPEWKSAKSKSTLLTNSGTMPEFPKVATLSEEKKAEIKQAFELLQADARADEFRRIASQSSTVKGFWEVVEENKEDLIPAPFAGMMDEFQEATTFLDLATRYREGNTSDSEELELYRMLAEQQRRRNIGGNVGEMLTMMPQFMVDIAAGSGLFSFGKKGTQKAIEKTLKKETFDALEKRLIGRGLLAVPGIMAGTTAAFPVSGSGMALEQYQQAMVPELELRGDTLDNFRLAVGEDTNSSNAAKEAIAGTYIELLSERTGGTLTGLAKPIKDRMIKTAFGRYLMRYNSAIQSKQISEIVDSVGFNGILGEMFEERFADLARYATGLDEDLHIPDANQLAAELIAFSVPAGAFYATDRFLAIDKFLDPQQGVTPNVWNAADKLFSDVEVLTYGIEKFDDPKLAGEIVRAKHGDEDARKSYLETTLKPIPEPGANLDQAESADSPFFNLERRRTQRLREEIETDRSQKNRVETRKPEYLKQQQSSGFIGRALTPISGRLRRIHPKLATQMRRMEFNMQRQNIADIEQAEPFLKSLRAIRRSSKADYQALDLALKNQNDKAVNVILEKYDQQVSYKELRALLDTAFERAHEADIPIEYRDEYYPRLITDLDGLMEYLGQNSPDLQNAIKEEIQKLELERIEKGKAPLSETEKTRIVNDYLKRMYPLRKKRPANAEDRKIDIIDEELNQFYARPEDALLNYINNLNEDIAFRDFFGKHKVLEDGDKALNIDRSIGLYLNDLLNQGLISYDDLKELHDPQNKSGILNARFGFRATRGTARVVRELGYLTTMGQISSAITQLTDQAFSIWYSGLQHHAPNAAKALIAMNEIKARELGVDRIGEEFRTKRGLATWLDRVFTATGLKAFDRFGKNTLVNAAIDKWRARARKDKLSASDMNELRWMFGSEAESIIEDLREERRSVNTDFLAYNVLSNFQPVSLSEMPAVYLQHPNGRILYMLKTFTLKQLETYRREILDTTKLALQRGEYRQAGINMAKGLGLLVVLWLTGMTTDAIKDFIYFQDDPEWDDLGWDNIWKLFGFSRYHIYIARNRSVTEAALKLTTLPAPYVEYPAEDFIEMVESVGDGQEIDWQEFESWRMVPFFGKFIWANSEKVKRRRAAIKRD